MSDALSKLLILLEAKDEATPALSSASGSLKMLGTEITSISRIAAGVAVGGLGAQLGLSLSEHFKDALTEVQTFGDQVFKLQQRIGISAQSASSLLSVFERFGVSSEDADRMLTFFSRGLKGQTDVTEGSMIKGRSFAGTLAELGVQAVDAAGKFRPMDEVLTEVQARMSALKDDGLTGARAMDLFSRSGANAAAIFNLTAKEFEDLRHEAQKMGVTLSQDNVNQIRTLAMAHHDMDEAVRGLTLQLGLAFIPALTDAARTAAEFAKGLNGGTGSDVSEFSNKVGVAVAKLKELKALADAQNQKNSAQINAHNGLPENTNPWDANAKTWSDRLNAAKDMLSAVGRTKDALGEAKDHALSIANNLASIWDPADQRGLGFGTALQLATAQADADRIAELTEQHVNRLRDDAQRLAASGGPPVRDTYASEAHAARVTASEAAKQAQLNREEQLYQLNQAEIAAKRELEIRQHQIAVLQRENLDLVKEAAAAELSLIPIKQQQADLELKLLKTQDQRAQLERDAAVARAQLRGMPASQALEDNQYQQRLIEAQIRAGILSGQGIPEGAIDNLISLKFAEPGLEVPALEAGRQITLATREQQRGQLETDLSTLPLRQQLASNAIDVAQMQRQLDAINAEQRSIHLTNAVDLADLEAKRQAIEDRLFEINQRQSNLAGQTFAVTLNTTVQVDGQGGIDWEAAGNQLANATVDALQKAVARVEGSAPTTVPGAGFASIP